MSQFLESCELLRGLHALGDDLQAEDDRAGDDGVVALILRLLAVRTGRTSLNRAWNLSYPFVSDSVLAEQDLQGTTTT
jgi:hypothetical protein